jgi:hypothetical protein
MGGMVSSLRDVHERTHVRLVMSVLPYDLTEENWLDLGEI